MFSYTHREDEQLHDVAAEVADTYMRDNMTSDQLEELMRSSFKVCAVKETYHITTKETYSRIYVYIDRTHAICVQGV